MEEMIKVKKLIELLSTYNQEAYLDIVVNNQGHNFEITMGSADGCTKETCKRVSLYIPETCRPEGHN